MKNETSVKETLSEVRGRMIQAGGGAAQDLGLGRIVGQVLVFLYLQPEACSLDDIERDLGLSKAAVSIAARQLESLGLVKRVWVKGDRRSFYRTADNLGQALQQGVMSLIRQKIESTAGELDAAADQLHALNGRGASADVRFLRSRIDRVRTLSKRIEGLLSNPLVRLLEKVR